jgi:hypothetical protein
MWTNTGLVKKKRGTFVPRFRCPLGVECLLFSLAAPALNDAVDNVFLATGFLPKLGKERIR